MVQEISGTMGAGHRATGHRGQWTGSDHRSPWAAATENVMGFPVCREEVEEEGVNQAPAGTQHSPSVPHASRKSSSPSCSAAPRDRCYYSQTREERPEEVTNGWSTAAEPASGEVSTMAPASGSPAPHSLSRSHPPQSPSQQGAKSVCLSPKPAQTDGQLLLPEAAPSAHEGP